MSEPWEDDHDRIMRRALEAGRAALIGGMLNLERGAHMELARWRGRYACGMSTIAMCLIMAVAFMMTPYFFRHIVVGGLVGFIWSWARHAHRERFAIRAYLKHLHRVQDALAHMEAGGSLKTYQIAANGRSITCLVCNMTSHSMGDVGNLWCENCKRFHKR